MINGRPTKPPPPPPTNLKNNDDGKTTNYKKKIAPPRPPPPRHLVNQLYISNADRIINRNPTSPILPFGNSIYPFSDFNKLWIIISLYSYLALVHNLFVPLRFI